MKSIYLMEATLSELTDEIKRRFEELAPVPDWAAPVVFTVATYYGIPATDLRSRRRESGMVKARQLAIALLAQFHPRRSRAEVCEVLGVEHHMYRPSIERTEQKVAQFPDFRAEVQEILQVLRETGHCRTSPQVTRPPEDKAAPMCGSTPTPA